MIILGIETSCDETSASILKDGQILSNIICTQIEHKKYGGVVPNIASKNHEKLILCIVKEAIEKSKINISRTILLNENLKNSFDIVNWRESNYKIVRCSADKSL